MAKYIIIPGCDDGNRGDQALIFQTKEIAERAGFTGCYSMLYALDASKYTNFECIDIIQPILGHPSRKFKNKNNMRYTPALLFKWGTAAMLDYFFSKLLLYKITRPVFRHFLSSEQEKTFFALQNCDACFVKGGGFLHSYGKLTDIYQIYYFLYHIRLAQVLKKPVYILPNSFGPFSAPGVAHQIQKVVSKCRMVTVRESLSKKALEAIGVKNELYPDLAFSLQKSKCCIPELQKIRELAGDRKLIGVTARPYRFPGSENPQRKYDDYVSSLSKMCQWLADNGYFPVLIEHVIAENNGESDIKCLEEISGNLKKDGYYIFSNAAYNCRDLKTVYGEMYAVIGTRFHSVIFSLSEEVPCIAITYGGNKGNGIMLDIGLNDFALSIEEISFTHLQTSFQKLEKEYSAYKKRLKTVLPNIHNAFEKLQNELSKLK